MTQWTGGHHASGGGFEAWLISLGVSPALAQAVPQDCRAAVQEQFKTDAGTRDPSGSLRRLVSKFCGDANWGDWTCSCGNQNFGKRDVCGRCSAPRPQPPPQGHVQLVARSPVPGTVTVRCAPPARPQVMPASGPGARQGIQLGDFESWLVSLGVSPALACAVPANCREVVRGSFKTDSGTRDPSGSLRRVVSKLCGDENWGDWCCPACGNHNFGKRDVCGTAHCGTPRPTAVAPPAG